LSHELGNEGKISDEDIEKITTSIGELFKHLNDKYNADSKLNEEVSDMIKTLYDERVFEAGIEQGIEKGIERGIENGRAEAYAEKIEMAKEMLIDGHPIEKIIKYSKLTEEKIREIEKTL
jgi:predicted transposase/invertase (TIGR01784 family)